MRTNKKWIARTVAISGLALMVAGCVAEPAYQTRYYDGYPGDATYYRAAPGETVVVVHDHDGYYGDADQRNKDYSSQREYGRRGNGNFHGTDAYDRHDD